MTFDTTRLRKGEIVAAVGAILLFVFLFFFKWYGVGLPDGANQVAKALGIDLGSASVNGWHGHTVLRWLMLLTIILALGLAFLTATQRTAALPVTGAVLLTAVAGLTTLLIAYRVIINEPGPNDVIDVKIGAWLGLLSLGVITYGGYLAMRDEGTSFADAREQARAAGSQARAAFDRPGANGSADEGAASAPPPPPPAPSYASEPPASEPPAYRGDAPAYGSEPASTPASEPVAAPPAADEATGPEGSPQGGVPPTVG